jgi:hypothetical protein
VRIGFANKLKTLAVDLFGLTYDQVDGAQKDRVLLQKLGLNMRDVRESVWVDYVINNLKPNDYYVLDDLRYKNELDALKKAGFILVRIEASRDIRERRIPNTFPKDENHLSETDLDDYDGWDVVIDNNNNDLYSFLNNAEYLVSVYK